VYRGHMSISESGLRESAPNHTFTGDGHTRGLAHGETLRDQIRSVTEALVEDMGGTAEVDRFLHETNFVPMLATSAPDLLAEVRGIATGSGIALPHVLAHNLMDEHWWWSQTSGRREACSVLAVPGSPALLGQTMDLPTYMDGSQALIRNEYPDGSSVAVLTSAGLIGLCGANSRGVGVCVNALSTLRHSPSGLPVAFVLRLALTADSASAAVTFIKNVSHASGQHYAILARDVEGESNAASLECSAGGAVPSADTSSTFGHANHPLATIDISDALPVVGSTSTQRQQILDTRGNEVSTVDQLQSLLTERTGPICVERADSGDWFTFGALAMQFDDTVNIRYTLGPPTEQSWNELTL